MQDTPRRERCDLNDRKGEEKFDQDREAATPHAIQGDGTGILEYYKGEKYWHPIKKL